MVADRPASNMTLKEAQRRRFVHRGGRLDAEEFVMVRREIGTCRAKMIQCFWQTTAIYY
jgi:hypothetical protein